jgi:hypothetical protein
VDPDDLGDIAKSIILRPAPHRLYRATVSEHFVLDPNDRRLPVSVA